MAFASQINHATAFDWLAVPLSTTCGDAQHPIEHGECLAAAARAVNHNQRLSLQPAFDQPADWRGLFAKVIRRNQPNASILWLEQRQQVPASLGVVVGIHALLWRHDHPRAMLCTGLVGVLLASS